MDKTHPCTRENYISVQLAKDNVALAFEKTYFKMKIIINIMDEALSRRIRSERPASSSNLYLLEEYALYSTKYKDIFQRTAILKRGTLPIPFVESCRPPSILIVLTTVIYIELQTPL